MRKGAEHRPDLVVKEAVVRESRSRPGWGIVKVRQRGIKQDGTVVLVMTRSFMVPTHAAAPKRARPPTPRD